MSHAVTTRLTSPGTKTTEKEEGPVHSAKAEEALIFVLYYGFFPLSHLYPFTLLHCIGV